MPNSQPQFDVNSPPNAVGSVLGYTCDSGYIPQGSVHCQVDGTWSQMSCINGNNIILLLNQLSVRDRCC